MIHCLNIKNLQYIFLMIFKKKSNWEGGWLGRDPNWKIPIRFDSFLKPSLTHFVSCNYIIKFANFHVCCCLKEATAGLVKAHKVLLNNIHD